MPLREVHVLRMLGQLVRLALHGRACGVAVQTAVHLWCLSGKLWIDEVVCGVWRHGGEDLSVGGEELVGLEVVPQVLGDGGRIASHKEEVGRSTGKESSIEWRGWTGGVVRVAHERVVTRHRWWRFRSWTGDDWQCLRRQFA